MTGLRSDPVHVIVNRMVLSSQIREKLYGQKTAWGDRTTRVYWANVIGYWIRRQVLTYADVRAIGADLAGRLSPDQPMGDGSYNEELDSRLRHCLQGYLNREAVRIGEERSSEEMKELRQGVQRKRVYAWMKAALLDGRCPECLQDVSEGDKCGHGYGRPAIDGKGGIVVDPS